MHALRDCVSVLRRAVARGRHLDVQSCARHLPHSCGAQKINDECVSKAKRPRRRHGSDGMDIFMSFEMYSLNSVESIVFREFRTHIPADHAKHARTCARLHIKCQIHAVAHARIASILIKRVCECEIAFK